jgi:hypothetical protein
VLDQYQHQQLTGQAECYIHFHPRVPLDQTSAAELENATRVKAITLPYTLTAADEQVSVSATGTLTLPPVARGKEYHVTLVTAGDTLTIVPTSPDTVMGDTSLIATVQWTSFHLKADSTNWFLI